MTFYNSNFYKPQTKIISPQSYSENFENTENSKIASFDESNFKQRRTARVSPLHADQSTQTEDGVTAHPEEEALLRGRVRLLQDALDEQRTRNEELKKLLLVSLGNDLASHFTQLLSDLTNTGDRVSSLLSERRISNDNIDQLSIETDLWKNKFIAGRILVNELAEWKEQFAFRYQQSLDAIHNLLQERQRLRLNLVLLSDQLHVTSSHLCLCESPKDYSNTIDLVNHNLKLAKKINDLLSSGASSNQTVIRNDGLKGVKDYTSGEEGALEVLKNRPDIHADRSTKYMTSLAAKDHQLLEQMALSVCRNCRGDIFVV